jgi:hypothetical protein
MVDITVRSDKGTRIALGCTAVFLGLFMALGLGVVALVLVGNAPDKLPGVLMGLVFAGVPGLGLLFVRWMWRESARREERRRRAPDQPWAWDQDITGGVVEGVSPTLSVGVWIAFAGVWLGFMALVTGLGWEKIGEEPAAIAFVCVFWAVGLFLAGMAVRATVHARRFGRSTLAMDATPALLGHWLSGVVRAPLAVEGAELQLTVECVRTTYNSSSSSSGSSRSTWTVWRTTRLIDGTRCGRREDHVEIPFAVRLPTSAEASREHNDNVLARLVGSQEVDLAGENMDWYVNVTGRLPGVDYSDRFKVPVGAPTPQAPPVPARPPRVMPELSGDVLAQRLPGRLEYRPDADVFVFPMKPSWLVTTGLLAVPTVLPFLPLPVLEAVSPDVLKWGAIVCGVLAALSVVGIMLDTRSIEVAPDSVRVRRGVFGLGFHRTIDRRDIAAVEEEASRSDPPSYSVNIRLHDGTSYWAAMALREADQAAALAARLRGILQLAPPAS